MRVLLVEDDPMIAQAVKGALADEMYTVEHVANGRDALMMLSVNEYGFVLLDLGLPGLDGMTVLRTLRENAEGSKKMYRSLFSRLVTGSTTDWRDLMPGPMIIWSNRFISVSF